MDDMIEKDILKDKRSLDSLDVGVSVEGLVEANAPPKCIL